MREATTQDASQRLSNFLIGCARLCVQQRFRGQDHATQTETALRCAFVDESLLDGMELLWCAEPLQGRNLVRADGPYWKHAGAHRLAATEYCARSALRHSAPELWSSQAEFVTQNKKQGSFRIGVDAVQL